MFWSGVRRDCLLGFGWDDEDGVEDGEAEGADGAGEAAGVGGSHVDILDS